MFSEERRSFKTKHIFPFNTGNAEDRKEKYIAILATRSLQNEFQALGREFNVAVY